MDAPYQAGPDIHVLAGTVAVPGVGVLTVNAYLLMAQEPVLIDTGLGIDSDEFVSAVSSIVDPAELRWVWLTHDDSDHTGSLPRIMELAPNAKLVTHALGALRMAAWWPVPLDRVHAIRGGDELHVGDRTLTAMRPPLYDNPMSTGVFDRSNGAFFCVDSFGAILPEATQQLEEVPDEALAGGMAGWAAFDSPWMHLVDREKFAAVVHGVRALDPSQLLSSHLPAASGSSLDRFIGVIEGVPDAEPFVAPDAEAFSHIAAALMAGPQPPAAAS